MTLEEAYRIAIASMRQELDRIAHHIRDYERGVYTAETRAAAKRRGELTAAIEQLDVQITKATMGKEQQ